MFRFTESLNFHYFCALILDSCIQSLFLFWILNRIPYILLYWVECKRNKNFFRNGDNLGLIDGIPSHNVFNFLVYYPFLPQNLSFYETPKINDSVIQALIQWIWSLFERLVTYISGKTISTRIEILVTNQSLIVCNVIRK